jgi:hypothetical protein
MIEAGSRKRKQPAPAQVVFEALTAPDQNAEASWLRLTADEHAPKVLEAREPGLVVWSSLWPNRPDAQVRFDLPNDNSGGTDLRWTLLVDEPQPEAALLGHLRARINTLINDNLRESLDQ